MGDTEEASKLGEKMTKANKSKKWQKLVTK